MEPVFLPRSSGFIVRWRARAGMLPGQVSTAALVSARRLRWLAPLGLLPMIAVAVVLVVVAVSPEESSEEVGVVAAAFDEAQLPSNSYPYRIVLDDGTVVDLDDDPEVVVGDEVVVRQTAAASPRASLSMAS